MVFTPPSVVAPNDGALGQAGLKDAQGRHVATLAISLVFCPSNIIELILLSENETYERILQNILRLFFEIPLTADLREKFHRVPLRPGAKPVSKF
jgi:hypothetical protein